MSIDVERYLARIGYSRTPETDLPTLTELHRLHMTAVPFENLDIASGHRVTVDPYAAVEKILDRGRGGWCFEVNGAFALLLEALGFPVTRLGAAVLLDGPSVVLEHLALEVTLDEPYLADVGFGENFVVPLALNRSGPQDGGNGTYELLPSPQGTTLAQHVDGVPEARYRFKRVAHSMEDFAAISDEMQTDDARKWKSAPFATRLIDGGPDRVTLRGGRLKVIRSGVESVEDVPADAFGRALERWFGIEY